MARKPLPVRRPGREHGRILDTGPTEQGGAHMPRLHPAATNLYLPISPAEVDARAVAGEQPGVAGAEAADAAGGVGQKTGRPVPVQVTSRDRVTADHDLAGYARW